MEVLIIYAPGPVRHDSCSRLFSFAEMATGIIAGCLPVLPRFFQQCSRRKGASLPNTKSSSNRRINPSNRSWQQYSCTKEPSQESGGRGSYDLGPPRLSTTHFSGHFLNLNSEDFPAVPKAPPPASSIELKERSMECFYEEEDGNAGKPGDLESDPGCIGTARTLETRYHL